MGVEHRIRVAVVDDHPAIRHGLISLLAPASDITVVAQASSGRSAMQEVDAHRPDVVLLDIRLPGSDGIRTCRALRREYPDLKIIIFTSYVEDECLMGALEAGAHGYLLKTCSETELIDSIRAVYRGERLLAPGLLSRVLTKFEELAQQRTTTRSNLSPVEIQILLCMAAGDGNREIAVQMHWSEPTVKRRVQDICHKLDVRDRTHAVAEALRRGLI